MSGLARFEGYRYIGVRDTMHFYDCEDDAQLVEVRQKIETDGLVEANLIQTFAPDTPTEARNRGFVAAPGLRSSETS